MADLLFVDVETTSLERPSSPTPGEVWEVAAVRLLEDGCSEALQWFLPVSLEHADPKSLEIGRFHERYPPEASDVSDVLDFVGEFTDLAQGAHWVGNVPSFDEERIAAIFHANGHTGRFPWHYHLVDIEAVIAGLTAIRPPWDSEVLGRAIDVDPGDFERHTAMGDVEWCMAQWRALHG